MIQFRDFIIGTVHRFQPPNHTLDGLANSSSRRPLQAQQPKGQVIGFHFRESQLHRLVDVIIEKLIYIALWFRTGVFLCKEQPFRHFGTAPGLGTQGAETILADPAAQFRIIFRAAQISGQKLFFFRQYGIVDKPDQAVKVHDILFDRGAGQEQFERLPGNPIQGPGLPAALLIYAREGICFFKHSQIPGDRCRLFFMVSGIIISSNDNSILFKPVG